MSNDVIKAVAGDINPDFYERIIKTFPPKIAVYQKGMTIEDVAFEAGRQAMIDWIKAHARM